MSTRIPVPHSKLERLHHQLREDVRDLFGDHAAGGTDVETMLTHFGVVVSGYVIAVAQLSYDMDHPARTGTREPGP